MLTYHLVYISYAIPPSDEAELLNQARNHNKKEEITGMLLHVNGKFIQVLEGDQRKVKQLYHRIENDERHKRVTLLLEGESANRIFDKWSMGFKNLSDTDFKNLSGFQDTEAFFIQQNLTEVSNLVMVFLQLFYKKNFVDFPELVVN
ncbi:MAG: BLUF domain-containing protein [Flammeovirgaceae bacterium]